MGLSTSGGTSGGGGGGSGDMLAANNLSDLADKPTARTNLGLGTAATHPATDFATSTQGAKADNALAKANNLSDLVDASTARTNLGLGSAATQASSAFDVSGSASSAQSAAAIDATTKANAAQAAAEATAANANNLSSGTIPDARFPSVLPAVDGSQLTGLAGGGDMVAASFDSDALDALAEPINLAGGLVVLETGPKLPAVDGSQLTGIPLGGKFVWNCSSTAGGAASTFQFTVDSNAPSSVTTFCFDNNVHPYGLTISDLSIMLGWIIMIVEESTVTAALYKITSILTNTFTVSFISNGGISLVDGSTPYTFYFLPPVLSSADDGVYSVFNDGVTSGQITGFTIINGLFTSPTVVP